MGNKYARGTIVTMILLVMIHYTGAGTKVRIVEPTDTMDTKGQGDLTQQALAMCEKHWEGYYRSEKEDVRVHTIPQTQVVLMVCASDPGWSESLWIGEITQNGSPELVKYSQIHLHGSIVTSIDIKACENVNRAIVEIKDTTHMGTRTRRIMRLGKSNRKLYEVGRWTRYGKQYPPDGLDVCRYVEESSADLEKVGQRGY